MPENCIDLIVTSPPYSDVVSYGKKVNVFKTDEYVDWITKVAIEMQRVLKPSGSLIFNIGNKTEKGKPLRSLYVMKTIIAFVDQAKLYLHDEYFWMKNAMPNGSMKRLHNDVEYIYHFVKMPGKFKCYTDKVRVPYAESTVKRCEYGARSNKIVLDDGTSIPSERKLRPVNAKKGKIPNNIFKFHTACLDKHAITVSHPAPFNKDLPEWFIKWLTDENDIVLDPFMGSGTTAEAAILLGRQYLGFEVNNTYIAMSDIKIKHANNNGLINF